MAVDSQWANTVLLLPFEDDLLDARRHVTTASGGAALSSAVGNPFGSGNSLYLDGSGDYLTIPGTDFAFPAYCAIEAWIRPLSLSGYRVFYAGESSRLAFYMNGTALEAGIWGVAGIVNYSSAITTANVWHYVALKLNGSTAKLYLDGTEVASSAYSTSIVAPTTLSIGRDASGGYFYGYIGPMRVTKDNRTITLPSAPFPRPTISGVVYNASAAPVAKTILVRDRSTQRFLGGANSDATTGLYEFHPWDFGECTVTRIDELCDPMTDECVFNLDAAFPSIFNTTMPSENTGHGPNHGLTFNGNATTSADGGSFVFDGSGDCIQSTSSWYTLALEDFDISIEFMPINGGRLSASYNRLFAIGADGSVGSLNINCTATSNPTTILCEFYDTAYRSIGSSGATTYANNTWHKLRLRRVSGVFYLEMNGTLVSTSAALAYNIAQTTVTIGAAGVGGNYFYGNIGKVRISRGPRRAAASISNALLLTGPADGGSGENAIIYDRVIPGG